MNKLQREMFRNKMFSKVRSSNRSGSHNGCLRIFPNNTIIHEMTKFYICYKLLQEGWNILTEAIFENGCRADIVAVLDRAVIIEIETPKSKKAMAKKLASKDNYPEEFEKILVVTDEFNIDTFCI